MQKILVCAALLAGSLLAAEPTTRILIVYYSQTGNTEKMAKALGEGAAGVAGAQVFLRKVGEVKPEDIKSSNGILLGSPVQMHNLSIEAIQFLAQQVGAALGKDMGEGRTAGVFCTGGSASLGKEMARLEAIAMLLELRFVIIGGLEAEMWGNLGPEATTGSGGVSEKDLTAARRSGERFARLTRQFQAK